MLNVWFMIEFLGVFWSHLKVLEKLGKVLFSRAFGVKCKPLIYVFIRPVDKCQPSGNARVNRHFKSQVTNCSSMSYPKFYLTFIYDIHYSYMIFITKV